MYLLHTYDVYFNGPLLVRVICFFVDLSIYVELDPKY